MAFFVLMAVHLWRVRKDGLAVGDADHARDLTERALEVAHRDAPASVGVGVAPIVPADAHWLNDGRRVLGVVDTEDGPGHVRNPEDEVFAWPHLLIRHQVVALVVCAVVLGMGILWEAPLRELANPNLTPEPAKAPWYFVGLQELLAHFDPLVAGVLAPAMLVLGLVVLPYADRNPSRRAEHRRVGLTLFWILFGALAVLTVIGALFRGPGWAFVLPWEHLYFEP
jgi:hypothetical protein